MQINLTVILINLFRNIYFFVFAYNLFKTFRHANILFRLVRQCDYLFYSTLLYFTLPYPTLPYPSTLLYSTLLCSALLYSTLLYSTLLSPPPPPPPRYNHEIKWSLSWMKRRLKHTQVSGLSLQCKRLP